MKITRKVKGAYPVFMMALLLEELGYFESFEALDVIWEQSVEKYIDFTKSDYNNENESEYDCIQEYIKENVLSYGDM